MKIINLLIVINLLCSGLLFAQNNEFLLDTNLFYIPAPYGQNHPAVAFDGTNYFVVWLDWRNEISYHSDMSWSGNIYGCRVTPEGVILDSAGIPLSYYIYIVGYPFYNPGIAYGDGIFLVAWTDYRDGLIHAVRIDTNGVVLDPDGFVILEYPSLQNSPSVAFDGTNFFVAWWDNRVPFGTIYGCRVTPEAEILEPEGIAIVDSGVLPCVSVSFGITNYLVIWSSSGSDDIYGARVDTAGTVLDTLAIPICIASDDQLYATVCFGGENYFVTWEDKRSGTNTDIYGTRVDTAGVVLDTNGIAISTLMEDECPPSLNFDGTNYLVTWSDYANVYCARVDTCGVMLDSVAIVVSQDTIYSDASPSVAFDGTNYLVVWGTDFWLWDGEVVGARVETSGVVIDTTSILLSMSAYPGYSSSASFDGTNYFAVWEDYCDTASVYIYGTRVDTIGSILDTEGIPIIEGNDPSIAFDGTNYLVACSDENIKGARINTGGTVLDTFTIYNNSLYGCDDPSIVFNGTNYFVVWRYLVYIYGNYNIYGSRIDTTGIVLDTNAIVVSDLPYDDMAPAVAFDDTNYFVVWHYGTDLTTYNIYGARVTTAGFLLDTIAIPVTTGTYHKCYPSIAFDGINYFVVWQDNRNGYADIYGARVTPSGVVLNPGGIPLCTAPSAQYKPEIKFDGHNYCVIWEDWRNGDYTDIYGCYVTPSGTVTQKFPVSIEPNLQIEPALVKGPDKFLVTYTGFVDSLNGRPANAMRIWGQFQEFVGIEETEGRFTHDALRLFPNYPNPFSQTTTIRYQIPTAVVSGQKTQISLKIYDVTGRLVRQFDHKTMRLSDYVVWDGKDDLGNYVGAGVYFYQLKTADFCAVEKMILLR